MHDRPPSTTVTPSGPGIGVVPRHYIVRSSGMVTAGIKPTKHY